MALAEAVETGESIGDAIVAIRDRWHTKKHPFFQALAEGTLELHALGIYMAQHYRFVCKAVPGFGLLVYRAPADVRKAMIENLAEEEGLLAGGYEGAEAHDHFELIFAFCRAAGLTDDEVRTIQRTPAWWARTLHYVGCQRDEPLGVALAMLSTQEGQQVALNRDLTIPALQEHYGFAIDDPAIGFFVEHAEADMEHSTKQLDLCVKYLDTPALRERALDVCEEAVRLRWASITDIWRDTVADRPDPLPPGVDA